MHHLQDTIYIIIIIRIFTILIIITIMLIILKCAARRRAQPPRSASEMLHQGGANTPSLVKNINSTDFDKKKDGDEYDICTQRRWGKTT